jgi:hypothetical protein
MDGWGCYRSVAERCCGMEKFCMTKQLQTHYPAMSNIAIATLPYFDRYPDEHFYRCAT